MHKPLNDPMSNRKKSINMMDGSDAPEVLPQVSNVVLTRDNISSNFIHIEEDFNEFAPFVKQLHTFEDRVSPIIGEDSFNFLLDGSFCCRGWLEKKMNDASFKKLVIIIFLSVSILIYISVIILVTSLHHNETKNSKFTAINENGEDGYTEFKPQPLEQPLTHHSNELDSSSLLQATTSSISSSEILPSPTPPSPLSVPMSIENNLANINSPLSDTDVPVLWHIPRAGGTTYKIIALKCLDFVLASEFGGRGHEDDSTLKVVSVERLSGKHINIDVSKIAGIDKAKELGLAASGLTQLFVSSLFYAIPDVFTSEHKGRMITLMRHPNEIVQSLYFTLKKDEMTFLEYLQSQSVPESWMVRQLSGNRREALSDRDLELAKIVLREKFVIGLMKYPVNSFHRFVKYFSWDINQGQRECAQQMLSSDWIGKSGNNMNVDSHESQVKDAMERLNRYDILLYEYAEEMFQKQGEELFA